MRLFSLNDQILIYPHIVHVPPGKSANIANIDSTSLTEQKKGIVSDNLEDIKVVQSWLSGTDVEIALIKMHELEAEAEKIKKELSAAKKAVAKVMRD
jgi:hypothetical protein